MYILSTIDRVPNRAYNNAAKAFMRDPNRPIRLIDFMTYRERYTLMFCALPQETYEIWLERTHYEAWVNGGYHE